MKDFMISAISFTLIAAVVWGSLFLVGFGVNVASSFGIPSGLAWFTAGFVAALCNPASALSNLCVSVYERVDRFFWRLS